MNRAHVGSAVRPYVGPQEASFAEHIEDWVLDDGGSLGARRL